ncbi:alpha/beta hydrolase family protein [Algoriphagus sediminis]|uniref:Prolyl oligopeptidase family serine peptidase n=1 Tax=Algoriphagus sediminis TaxID=3057113 RepID=A0ABT7YD37_9BACT|nr:prolyl oligopeptidase family serine peptidase [Algoriphagus sediminis]MDN3204402.1 prolyl oligopeptidase family serine peptidase [Algoriphagus sediminis]
MKWIFTLALLVSTLVICQAQEEQSEIEALRNQVRNLRHSFDAVSKQLDDVLWYEKVGDVAYIDKVYLTGPPKDDRVEKNKTAQGYGNPLRFQSYIFIPRDIDPDKKYPLMVLPHGGVHSNFNTFYAHIIRELMAQQYIVVAAEYRGSTGYGRGFYESIDYGGLEIEDVFASRNYMVENYDIVDSNRIGIFGWSHGGMITLHNIFEHPKDYKVAYAGVPVSDLIARMGYKSQGYRDLYSADYHIGKTAAENVEEYRKRSPAWQAHKLETPLLIHTNTNDEDVNVFEVEHLIKSLKAEDKDFEYEIYEDIPGGHTFDRIDTKKAQEVRLKIYKFLASYLSPPNEFKNVKDLRKAAYRF